MDDQTEDEEMTAEAKAINEAEKIIREHQLNPQDAVEEAERTLAEVGNQKQPTPTAIESSPHITDQVKKQVEYLKNLSEKIKDDLEKTTRFTDKTLTSEGYTIIYSVRNRELNIYKKSTAPLELAKDLNVVFPLLPSNGNISLAFWEYNPKTGLKEATLRCRLPSDEPLDPRMPRVLQEVRQTMDLYFQQGMRQAA